jgi:hypothetical protein
MCADRALLLITRSDTYAKNSLTLRANDRANQIDNSFVCWMPVPYQGHHGL